MYDNLIANRYQVVKTLGSGGMSTVYLVEDVFQDHQQKALKMIRPEVAEAKTIHRFKNEFRAMAELHHPNLAEVYDYSTTENGECFFTMEYFHGKDLRDLRGGKGTHKLEDLNYDIFYAIVVQICRALEYIHSRGMIHYDIKPSNILYSETEPVRVKLMDFGLAQELQTKQDTGTVRGTIYFIAPEMIRRERIDQRADLYSLGVVLYRIVTGTLPFTGKHSAEILKKHVEQPPPSPRRVDLRIPEGLERIILKLLAKNPNDRYASANEIIQAINELTQQEFDLETTETRRSYILSGRFVERENELTLLKQSLTDVVNGICAQPLVLISGGAGMGKDRLIREFRIHCQLNQVDFYQGNCYKDGALIAQPFIEILSGVVRSEFFTKTPELLQAYAPQLVKLVPDIPVSLPEQETTTEIITLIDSVVDFLIEFSAKRPLVLVVNQFHWADSVSVELLKTLAERTQGNLLLCINFRETDIENKLLSNALDEFRQQNYTQFIELKPFTNEDVSNLITSMFGTNRPPSDFVEKITQETNGNPLLIQEVMKSLAENDLIYHKDGILYADVDELFEVDIPQSIAVLVERKLAKMSEFATYVLEVMAVLNKPATADMLMHVVGDMELPVVLEKLYTDHLIQREKGAEVRYIIAHDGIRKYLYENLPRRRRQHLHKLIGTMLETQSSKMVVENAEELAYHFANAGDRVKTGIYAIRAGERAERLYANEKAISFYMTALSILDVGQADLRENLCRKLGNLYENLGEFDRALSTFEQLGNPSPAVLFQKASIYNHLGDFDNVLAVYDKLDEMLHQQADRVGQSRVSAYRSTVYLKLGRVEEARQAAERALELAGDDPPSRSTALNAYGILYDKLGDYEKTITYFQQALKLREESADVQRMAASYNNLGLLYTTRGEYSYALDCYQRGSEILDRVGNFHGKANLLNNLGEIYFVQGDFESAEHGWLQSLSVGEKLSIPVIQAEASYGLARLDHLRGAYQDAEFRLKTGIELSQQIGYIWLELTGEVYLAALYLDLGAIERGMGIAQNVMERAETHQLKPLSAQAAALFGRAAYLQKAHEYAAMYFQQALEQFGEMGDPYHRARVLLDMAQIQHEQGNTAAAIVTLNQVEAIENQLDSKVLRIFRLFTAGSLMEDPTSALDSLQLANQMAEELRMFPMVWQIHHEIGRVYFRQENTGLALNEYKNASQLMEFLGASLVDETLQQAYKMHDRAMQLSQDIQFLEYQISEERGKLSQAEIDKIVEGASTFRKKESKFEEILHDLFMLHQEAEGKIDTLERERRRFRLLFNASRTINSTLDFDDLMHKVMQMTVEITKAERACVLLFDENRRWHTEIAYRMNHEIDDYQRFRISHVAIERLLETGETVHTHDASKETLYQADPAVIEENIRTIMVAPMYVQDRLIGALYVDNQIIEDDFMLQTLEFFQSLADQAAVAIENARLYERVATDRRNTERLNNEITKLYEIGKALTSVLDLDDLLELLIDKMLEITGAQRGFLMLLENGELTFKTARDEWGNRLEAGEFRISRSIPQSVLKSGIAKRINSLREHEDSFSSIADLKLQSILCVPLKAKDRIIGIVYLDSHLVSKEFTVEDLTLIETLAGQASIAIENARLYEDVAIKERLEQEFAIASQIQMGLLPKQVPQIDRLDVHGVMVPAKEVGGDYFDYITTGQPDELYLCIGDVSGKGVPAGLVMAMARTLLRPLIQTHQSTKDILVEVNRLLHPDMENSRFLTMLLLHWKSSSHTLHYTGAGQEHLIIYHAQTRQVERRRANGLMLGIIEDISPYLNEEQITLEPGDTVLLYTDGVTELRNAQGQMFGLRRLTQLVEKHGHRSAADLTEKILSELRKFQGNTESFDDITLLAIQYKPQ
ncbi:MAG: GAF domain-containing protein [Gemmatimonadetes bacterium]|nr:MAG: GAF domain-containing protein [Gemmatimonadota bacterium]